MARHEASPNAAAVSPSGCTALKLRQIDRALTRHYDAYVVSTGLKNTQYSLLSHVLRLGPLRPGDLARAMGLSASTLTRNVQPMVEAGWLSVDAGPDARSRMVHITEAGRAKRAEAQRHWRAAQESLNALLGTQRVAALHELIDESTARLRATDESTSGDLDD